MPTHSKAHRIDDRPVTRRGCPRPAHSPWLTLGTAAGGAMLFVALGTTQVSRPEAAQADASGGPTVTQEDQLDLGLTVYNSDLALVRDVRRVQLPTGIATLRFEDVAASLNPAAVHVRSLSAPAGLEVLEQNYEYDLLEPQKLLQKYVGREATLVRPRQQGGTTQDEEVRATLLALNNGPVWQIGNEIVTGLPSTHFRFPELPGNLYRQPTLLWHLRNDGPRSQQLEVSYLTGGLAWSADYVLTVGRDEGQASLDGWVTLTNTSGATYRDAKLQLVAGEINRVRARRDAAQMLDVAAEARVASAPQFAREAFSEYHLYSLGRRTTVGEKETKQVSLLGAPEVGIGKRFVVNGEPSYYRVQRPGASVPDRVEVYYSFQNAARNGLGEPLPAGVIRVYQADAAGGVHFVGEDRIPHTPQDETIDLHVGSAFDVVSERKQTDYRRLAGDLWEVAFEVRIRNRKASAIHVELNEPIGGDWEMVRASHQWTKTGAFAAQFDVPVPAGSEAIVSYRVRIR